MIYGSFDKDHRRFGKASNSEISRELGYSDAQFSRLINESATDGEYQRAIQNVDRIIALTELEKQVDRDGKIRSWQEGRIWFLISMALGLVVIISLLYALRGVTSSDGVVEAPISKYDMLNWSFESSFVNPYVKLDGLPEDCYYPCYRYQGRWELKNSYKVPFFRERSGFHYLATEVVLYARCLAETSPEGDVLEGYEYQKHEIWYDKRELPIDSFIKPENNTQVRDDYLQLDFSEDDNYVKVATVHTFFRNEFLIKEDHIERHGKVIGRDLEFMNDEYLESNIASRDKVNNIKGELNFIATNRLKDFSKPVSCNMSELANPDIHLVKDGDEISFHCSLTTSRVPIEYTKTYILADQFIRTSCRSDN